MQDLLLEASKIKSAQLKVKPGRQVWEQAPDFFKHTAFVPDAETTDVRKGPLELRIQHANKLKEEGNKSFSQDVTQALQLYTKAIAAFMWFDREQNKISEDMPLINTLDAKAVAGLPEQQVEEASQLAATCFSNAALCLLRQARHADAIYACSKALELDPYNVKALFRRAEAYHTLGTTADLELCVADLQESLQLEPGNAQVRAALAKYQAELREQNRKDRKTFAGMFQGDTLYPDDEKSKSDTSDDLLHKEPAPSKLREADKAVRSIKRSMAQVKAAQARSASQSGLLPRHDMRHVREQHSFMTVLGNVPWWGWLLIGLHLAYRIYKIWLVPMYRGNRAGAGEWEDDREL